RTVVFVLGYLERLHVTERRWKVGGLTAISNTNGTVKRYRQITNSHRPSLKGKIRIAITRFFHGKTAWDPMLKSAEEGKTFMSVGHTSLFPTRIFSISN